MILQTLVNNLSINSPLDFSDQKVSEHKPVIKNPPLLGSNIYESFFLARAMTETKSLSNLDLSSGNNAQSNNANDSIIKELKEELVNLKKQMEQKDKDYNEKLIEKVEEIRREN